MKSLLGQFYSRIRGSQENIASEGLVYILQRSKAAREVLNTIIRHECDLDFPDLLFEAQSTGKNFERPDITGKDEDGGKKLILEAKFWASLTENQPETYLNSLTKNSALIFICPDLRVRPLFHEINNKLKMSRNQIQEIKDRHILLPQQNKHIIIKTWKQILESIRNTLYQEQESELLADINQIIGFCDMIDNTAFLPIQDEDLAPKLGRRICSYFDVINEVVEEIKKHREISRKNLRSAGRKYVYARYFKMGSLGVSFELNFDLWARDAGTPFWIMFKDDVAGSDWRITDGFKKKIKITAQKSGYAIHDNHSSELYIALFPLRNVTGDEVVNDLAGKIIHLYDELSGIT